MQYAEILIKQKTKQWDATFVYEISPEWLPYISVGSIVEVPFGKKNIEGVVVGLKKSLPLNLKGQTKTIKRILQPGLKMTIEELEFSKWLAKKYLSSWSEAFFALLPPIPKKEITTQNRHDNRTKEHGGIYLLIEKEQGRFEAYREIIEKNISKQKTTWLIFPDLMLLKNFIRLNTDLLKNRRVISYHSDDNLKTRWEKWLKIRSGTCDIVLGSRTTLLNLPTNVGTIIIDESGNSGHNEDQSPRYNSTEVAKFWAKKLNISVVQGDIIPTLKQFVEAKENQLKLIKKRIIKPECEIKLIDMSKEKRGISLALEQVIEKIVKEKKTMVIFVPRRGLGALTICKDCGYSFMCPNCEVPLKYFEGTKILSCHLCNYKQTGTASCPECRGNNIETMGFGVEKVASWVKECVKNRYKIINLDKEHVLEEVPKEAIYITTQAIFRYPINPDISAIVGADLFLTKPDYTSSEIAFYTLYKLAIRTKNKMIIQARDIELPIYNAFRVGRYQNFLQSLLQERYTEKYPPYGELLKIEVSDKDEKKAEKKAEKLAQEIKNMFEGVKVQGPMPAYIHKEKNLYKFMVILKSQNNLDSEKLRRFLGGDTRVEIDPESIL